MRSRIVLAVALLCLSAPAFASQPCVIFHSNDPAKGSAAWTRAGYLEQFTLTYLAGDYPEGFPFKASIRDKEVDKIKKKGGRVIVLDPHYTREDLEKAKQSCAQ